MIRTLLASVLALATLSPAQAQTPAAPQCPFAATELSTHFSHPFEAVHLYPKSADDAHPSLSCERKGWLVNLSITGVNGKASVAAWNSKLEKLKRIP